MNEENLSNEKQQYLKGVSKAIYIIAKIGQICTAIAIPVLIVALVAITILMSSIDVKDNELVVSSLKDQISISEEIVNNEKVVTVKVGNMILAQENSEESISKIKEFLSSKPKSILIIYIDLAIVLIIMNLYLTRLVLKHLEKLFKNICNENTPFTSDNIEHLRKIGYLLIATLVLSSSISIVTSRISENNYGGYFNIAGVIEILFAFAMSFVFEYGNKLQSKSDE